MSNEGGYHRTALWDVGEVIAVWSNFDFQFDILIPWVLTRLAAELSIHIFIIVCRPATDFLRSLQGDGLKGKHFKDEPRSKIRH